MKGRQPKALVGSSGMTELSYSGSASGTVSWWGKMTGEQYKAGLKKPRIYVDNRDVEGALSDWKEQGKTVFKLAPIARAPQPVKLPTPQQEVEILAEIELAEEDLPFDDLPDEPEPQVEEVQIEATKGAFDLAEEHGIDLVDLWQGEKITVYDVKRYIESNTFDS